jgi:predicted permease
VTRLWSRLLSRWLSGPGRRALQETAADCEFEVRAATTARGQAVRLAFGALAILRAVIAALMTLEMPRREGAMDRLSHDLVYAWRRLRRTPGFTAIAVLTLALGVGANTALFSLVNGLLLKSIPVPNLPRIVALTEVDQPGARLLFGLNEDEYRAIEQSHLAAIETLCVSNPLIGALSGAGQTDVVSGELVSGHYFEVLGLVPRAGRLLLPSDDDAADAGTPVVISERLWRGWFGSDPSAVGQVVRMASFPLTIVGVAPEAFRGTWLPTLQAADLWAPVTAASHLYTVNGPSSPTGSRAPSGRTFALLRPGVPVAQVDAAVATIGRRLPQSNRDVGLTAVPAQREILFDDYEKTGLLLGSAVLGLSGLVFLIACANLTSLLLARGAARTGEMAIRIATGASRGRVFRLLLTETFLLITLAGLVGLMLAFAGTWLMNAVPVPALNGIVLRFDPSPDLHVFGYAFVIALLAALAVGVLPAWRAARTQPLGVLASSGADGGATMRGHGLRTLLVASQVAMSVVLLLGAGLYLRSASKSVQFNPGYDISTGAMASVNMAMHKYDEAQGRRLLGRLLEAARQIPGVESAALTSAVPAASERAFTNYLLSEGQPLKLSNGFAHGWPALIARVSPGFFRTLRLPLRRGRDFTDGDRAGAPGVVIISEGTGAKLWPGSDPIGRRLSMDKNGPLLEVVGVAADTATDLQGETRFPFLYVPVEQNYSGRMSIIVRTASQPAAMVGPLRQALRAVDQDLAVFDARTVADTVGLLLMPIRVTALVLGIIGALGLSIAVLGLYGVMAYLVSQRTREFGIRQALGASGAQIYTGVMRQGLRMLVLGVVPGVVVAFIGAGFLKHILYGIPPHDLQTFVAVPSALVLVGLVAAFVPARRAAHVEPNIALRHL